MKTKNTLFMASFLLITSMALAGQDRGGGDVACENRIKKVATDLERWIKDNGHLILDLKGRGSPNQYKIRMLNAIKHTEIGCVGRGDPGYPVVVYGKSKTCAVDRRDTGSRMTCDFSKVAFHDVENLNQLIHHEFATLAEFEIPLGGESDYEISNQIPGNLANQNASGLSKKDLNRLAHCRSIEHSKDIAIGTRCKTHSNAIFEKVKRDGFGNAWKDPSGLIWSDYLTLQNHSQASEFCRHLGAMLPTREDFLDGRSYRFDNILPSSQYDFWTSEIVAGGTYAYFFSPRVDYEKIGFRSSDYAYGVGKGVRCVDYE